MRWQFHYPKRSAFYPPDYEDPGLGGCEASLVVLTRALAARGHHVEVFNACYRPGVYEGVVWRMAWELEGAATPDVAVAVRFDEALWPTTTEAPHLLFWMLDDRPRGPAAFHDRFGQRGGQVVLASRAMQQRLDAAGVAASTRLIELPIETYRYTGPLEGREPICLFSSMPNRGLDAALQAWPRIRGGVPEAELWVTSGWQLWGFTNSESDDRWRQILKGRPVPNGVRLLGALPRSQLIEVQQQAAIGLYPCRFPEMFCLAAAEAHAAGAPMVTSPIDAMRERVDHGVTGLLVDGLIDEADTQARFADVAIGLLKDPSRRNAMATAARASTCHLAPDLIAARWEALVSF